MIERDLLQQLRAWRDSSRRKPLVLRGARQVGKTTLVKEFGKEFDALIAAGTDDHDVYYVITDMGGDDGILASLLAEADPDTFTAEVN